MQEHAMRKIESIDRLYKTGVGTVKVLFITYDSDGAEVGAGVELENEAGVLLYKTEERDGLKAEQQHDELLLGLIKAGFDEPKRAHQRERRARRREGGGLHVELCSCNHLCV